MNVASNQVALAALLSVAVVPLTSLLKREHWSNTINFSISLLLSLAIAALQVFLGGTSFSIHSVQGLFALAGVLLGASQAVYQLYFKNSDFDKFLTSIGSKVNVVAPLVQDAATVASALNPAASKVAAEVSKVATDTQTLVDGAATTAAPLTIVPSAPSGVATQAGA